MTVNLEDRKRLVGIALGIFAMFSVLIYKFFYIQIIDGEKWSAVAKRQHFFVVQEPFQRGIFYSNTSVKKGHLERPHPFVLDIEKYHLFIDPVSIDIEHRDTITNFLITQLDLSSKELIIFRSHFNKKSRSRKLAMWLDREKRDQILDWWQPYARKHKIARNALYFVADYQRSYPFGKLLGQVLHTVQNQKDEITKQALPTGGLELALNSYLKGRLGKRLLKRSPRHFFETGKVITSPENGADVYLTINHTLQAIAEEEIEKGVKKCDAKGGWAVMMDPHTGEILALAQYPFFYPMDYRKYFNDVDLIDHTRCKPLTDAPEPGSVVKPLTLAIVLKANQVLRQLGEEPIFDPEAKIGASDGRFHGRSKVLTDVRTHKYLNMDMALQKSSNIYLARLIEKVIERLGADWYRNELKNTFGFGQKTYIELPGESAGLLPTPGRLHPNGTLEWSLATPYSLAMGHNFQANSIQLLRSYAVLANGGFLVQPTLIQKIVKTESNGVENVIINQTQQQPRPRVLDPNIAKKVVRTMKYVTKPGGSGRRADILGFTEVGKTGTVNKIADGQYSNSQYIASFMGFAPVEDPAFVLIVVIDEPECRYISGVGNNHYGGIAAAPVFKEIGKRTLEYLGITPDDPHGYPVSDPRYDPELADWIFETRKLQEMYEKWNK